MSRNFDVVWNSWRLLLWRDPLRRAAIEERLLALVPEIRERLGDARSLGDEWRKVGIDVRAVAMTARGSCSATAVARTVFVNASDPLELQRYTVAHELAHLLLVPPNGELHLLGRHEEEALCERFACRLLIPAKDVSAQLTAGEPTPDDVLRLCGKLRLNVGPVVRAVGEQAGSERHHLLFARWRGHPRRPHDRAFRVETAAGNSHVFVPYGQRLSSIGLVELAAKADAAGHGDWLEGADTNVRVHLRGLAGERSSAVAHGPVAWRARRQGVVNPFIVAVLDLSAVLDAALEAGGMAA